MSTNTNNYDLSELDSIIKSNKLKNYIKKVNNRYFSLNIFLIVFPILLTIMILVSAIVQHQKTANLIMTIIFSLTMMIFFLGIVVIIKIQEKTGTKKLLNSFTKEDWIEVSKQIDETTENLANNQKDALTLFTKDYLVIGVKMPVILKYTDIVWGYNVKTRINGQAELGTYVELYTKNGQKFNPIVRNDKEFFAKLLEKNNTVAIGYTDENKRKFSSFLKLSDM